ncbi:sigma-70 family RNA polymerase sigma factor [bacterium]|nr:sigma-70 family RNA polymerase sigma factor [bacterium]
MNEQMALRLCLLDHDPRGFEFLVNKYRREAYYHAFTLLRDQEEAVDACQESFTRAFASLPLLQKLPAFYPWFYTILRNCCLNVLKKRKYRQDYLQKNRLEKRDRQADNGPLAVIDQQEQRSLVWEVLGCVGPEDREILMMKYFQGYDYHEISQILAIPRGTVMSRLYYARKAFKQEYEKRTCPDGVRR